MRQHTLFFDLLVTFIIISYSAFSAAAAEAPPPPPPPCSLNGDKDNITGVCICDKPWTGIDCEILQLLPVSFPQGYGMSPQKTTWGGDVLFQNGKYHLYASAMRSNCSLRHWHSQSQIEHAVSDRITGPYEFQHVAVPAFSHNPKVIQLADGKLALIHIGTGSESTVVAENNECSSGLLSSGSIPMQNNERKLRHTSTDATEGGSTIHLADSPDGPWKPLLNHTLGHCNNPAPFVVFASCEKAHIIYVVCSQGGYGQLKRANNIRGPWETVSTLAPSEDNENDDDSKKISYEDPALWIDQRGFHIIWHAYIWDENPPHGHDCRTSTVAKYMFSQDGKQWYNAPGHPYGTQIEVRGQGNVTVATRERPSLIFETKKPGALNGQSRMTYLLNAVCSAPNCPDGPPAGCVNCKYDHWDYTLIQPLAVA